MTKAQTMQKVRELAQTARRDIIAECEKLIASGGVDMRKYEDNYFLPKILMTAAMERRIDQFMPGCAVGGYATEAQKAVRNLLQM